MQNHLIMAATLILFATNISLAEENPPAFQLEDPSSKASGAKKKWKFAEGSNGSMLKEVEEIRKQLGPEYSIESKTLGIERDHSQAKPPESDNSDEEWPGTKLYKEVRELVNKFRHDARHLEEMAAQAEHLSEFALADQLRGMARRQWEAARELSNPYSTRPYHAPRAAEPYRPAGNPPKDLPGYNVPPSHTLPSIRSKPVPQYGAPNNPSEQSQPSDASQRRAP
ncbi:hypothetical protein [Bremerella alba]|uniref:Secreted protein n=1 Tax=Bremerella alba TaxID=980252 RepID=A0A7V9A9D1_9BACT|nr:hypothetical protein [Bremerella alba]MBA2117322.1 hypothetical protein [Bremerella alba]